MAGSITVWLDRMRDGDNAAATRLWNYFSPNLLRKTAPECRNLRICDEEDIVTVAFLQLTRAMKENKADGVTNRKEFWRLLCVITKRKIRDWIRYDKAKSRGGECDVISIDAVHHDFSKDFKLSSTNRENDQVSLMDRFIQMVDKMDRPEFGKIIKMKVQGCTNSKIARELGLSLRTTQYLIQDIKEAWIKTFKEDC